MKEPRLLRKSILSNAYYRRESCRRVLPQICRNRHDFPEMFVVQYLCEVRNFCFTSPVFWYKKRAHWLFKILCLNYIIFVHSAYPAYHFYPLVVHFYPLVHLYPLVVLFIPLLYILSPCCTTNMYTVYVCSTSWLLTMFSIRVGDEKELQKRETPHGRESEQRFTWSHRGNPFILA